MKHPENGQPEPATGSPDWLERNRRPTHSLPRLPILLNAISLPFAAVYARSGSVESLRHSAPKSGAARQPFGFAQGRLYGSKEKGGLSMFYDPSKLGSCTNRSFAPLRTP